MSAATRRRSRSAFVERVELREYHVAEPGGADVHLTDRDDFAVVQFERPVRSRCSINARIRSGFPSVASRTSSRKQRDTRRSRIRSSSSLTSNSSSGPTAIFAIRVLQLQPLDQSTRGTIRIEGPGCDDDEQRERLRERMAGRRRQHVAEQLRAGRVDPVQIVDAQDHPRRGGVRDQIVGKCHEQIWDLVGPGRERGVSTLIQPSGRTHRRQHG